MTVEHIDIIEPHATEALVERSHQILSRAPIAVRTGVHVISGLRRYEHLITVRLERLVEHITECLFGRTVTGAVVVGKIKRTDAVIKRVTHHVPASCKRVDLTEIMPHAKRDLRQFNTASPVLHAAVISVFGGFIYGFNHVVCCSLLQR